VWRLIKLFEAIKGDLLGVNISSAWQNTWSGILFLLGIIMAIDSRI
jgi:hypothetical protein